MESWVEGEGRYVKRIAVMQINKGRSSFMNEMAAFYRSLGERLEVSNALRIELELLKSAVSQAS
jgi:hypothetical protein